VTSRLASLLDQEQDRIAVEWAMALSRMRPSAYVHRPLEELRRLGRSYLAELVTFLDTDDPGRLLAFVQREAALRLSMGFRAAEVVQGLIAFRDLAQEVCAPHSPEPAARLAIVRGLSDATDFTIAEFVAHFGRLEDERADEQLREVEELQHELSSKSIRDPVTDLFSRVYFDEHLAVEVKRAARYRRALSLLICDLDDFDDLRARQGERGVDDAVMRLANVVRDLTRDVDIKGRTGDSEVCVGLPETPIDAAAIVAERIRSEAADGTPAARGVGEREAIKVSVGLGAYPDHADSPEELMNVVRRARDRARLFGGNIVVQADASDAP
jgi:diguanylate cyclase (GGDEF)-like protein